MTEPQMSATERYRAQIDTTQAEIVELVCPSGFQCKFRKPSAFQMLFTMQKLPTAAADSAVRAWQADGLVPEAPEANGTGSQLELVNTALKLRDKVLLYSYEPKIVIGPATADNELSADDMLDIDLEYLFRWVASGGDASAMLATFPHRPQPSAVAGTNRKERRAKAKRASGSK